VVLQSTEPVAAALVELVEIAELDVAAEFLVAGEAAVGREAEQVGLEAGRTWPFSLRRERLKVAKVFCWELEGMAQTARRNT
jgi:hypothetical protein